MKEKNKHRGRRKDVAKWAFNRDNFVIFGVALAVLLLGYWSLAQEPVNGFLSLTFAPILLILAYCVLIPLAIIYIRKEGRGERD